MEKTRKEESVENYPDSAVLLPTRLVSAFNWLHYLFWSTHAAF